MTADKFRELALGFPGAAESSHMGHPDFRVNGKIFATLGYPDDTRGMVKLTPEQQDNFIRGHATAFSPVKGAWGLQGSTSVLLKAADEATLREALRMAWSTAAEAKPRQRASKRVTRGARS